MSHLTVSKKALWPILFLAMAIGYLSLSQEMLWMRLLNYASGSAPETFGHVLGIFLIGIAFGSLLGVKITKIKSINLLAYIAFILILSGLLYYFSVPIIALFREKADSLSRGMMVAYFFIALIAFLQGGLLTILSHLGAKSNYSTGRYISWVYLANILGSTAGPLITGFVLLEYFTIQQNILIISILSMLLGALVAIFYIDSVNIKRVVLALSVINIAIFSITYDNVNHRLLEKLHGWKYDSYTTTIQNRSGIIALYKGSKNHGGTVYGGGMYDGKFNIDPANDVNGIHRAFAIAALHPKPSKLLSIGLSTGSWIKVLADYQLIDELSVVEINPGYSELIALDPEQSTMLSHEKINYYYDDGRRWLKRNPKLKFDFILMNTTWHWRSMASNITSVEFFSLLKSHLLPGGVIYINTTGSKAIPYTAKSIFKHVVSYSNFIAASDTPFNINAKQRQINLSKFLHSGRQNNGNQIFPSSDTMEVFKHIVLAPLEKISLIKSPKADLITDDNMLVEYKINNRDNEKLYHSDRSWWATIQRALAN